MILEGLVVAINSLTNVVVKACFIKAALVYVERLTVAVLVLDVNAKRKS